jgi:hypothetical protein
MRSVALARTAVKTQNLLDTIKEFLGDEGVCCTIR